MSKSAPNQSSVASAMLQSSKKRAQAAAASPLTAKASHEGTHTQNISVPMSQEEYGMMQELLSFFITNGVPMGYKFLNYANIFRFAVRRLKGDLDKLPAEEQNLIVEDFRKMCGAINAQRKEARRERRGEQPT